jgi:hypothetical protein
MKVIFTEEIPQSFSSIAYHSNRLCSANSVYTIDRIDIDGDVRLYGPTTFYCTPKDFRKYLRKGIIRIVKE